MHAIKRVRNPAEERADPCHRVAARGEHGAAINQRGGDEQQHGQRVNSLDRRRKQDDQQEHGKQHPVEPGREPVRPRGETGVVHLRDCHAQQEPVADPEESAEEIVGRPALIQDDSHFVVVEAHEPSIRDERTETCIGQSQQALLFHPEGRDQHNAREQLEEQRPGRRIQRKHTGIVDRLQAAIRGTDKARHRKTPQIRNEKIILSGGCRQVAERKRR